MASEAEIEATKIVRAAGEEIDRLRADLAEAEKKLDVLEDSEACEAITLRTELAGVRLTLDQVATEEAALRADLSAAREVLLEMDKIVANLRAALAVAREVIEKIAAHEGPGWDLVLGDVAVECARAFLTQSLEKPDPRWNEYIGESS